ncbi:MAG: PHP domain-containing protein [Synergistaceae bacterium]|jgi:predicted metal-dependent phosphoesterase TrpH|nr:PHP domain-containing protein [Synergistaceae bacterium]
MITIDMHIHSTHSDGSYSVEEIVKAAKKRGLSLISLTDHDTTSGVASFMKECKKQGVNALSGIELSADESFMLHILGYRIDIESDAFESSLKEIRVNRDERNAQICKKLQNLGMDIELKDVKIVSGGEVVARPHIVTVMMQRGYVSSRAEAFSKYLGRGGVAFVPRKRLSPEKCIELIHNAGGVAVLAHPFHTRLDDEELKKLLKRLKDAGLWGVESIYTGNTPEETYKCLAWANEFDLYSTAGSDFHGATRPSATLGHVVTEDFLPWARLGVSI